MKKRAVSVDDSGRPGLVLDTGALLAIEAGKLTDVLDQANALALPIRLSGGAIAQAWRGGPRSARLAALLKKDVIVVALDLLEARRVGEFITHAKLEPKAKPDVVDAHAAFLALETRSLVYTTDEGDLTRYGVPKSLICRI